jgi:transcription antitermination factor NusG
MHHILSVLSGKEKVVKAILNKRGIECQAPPTITGYLIVNAPLPPNMIDEIPHIMGMSSATPEQIERLMEDRRETRIKEGMRVQIAKGEYAGFYGRVRRTTSHGNAIVDLGLYGKMMSIRISCDDIQEG